MRGKLLLYRANNLEAWEYALEQGFGGTETDVYYVKGRFWIGHPSFPIGVIPKPILELDDFCIWLKGHPAMKALIDVKTLKTWKNINRLYVIVREYDLSNQVIIHSIPGGLPVGEGLILSRKISSPYLPLEHYKAFTFGWVHLGPQCIQRLSQKYFLRSIEDWEIFLHQSNERGLTSIFTGPTTQKELEGIFNTTLGDYIDYVIVHKDTVQ